MSLSLSHLSRLFGFIGFSELLEPGFERQGFLRQTTMTRTRMRMMITTEKIPTRTMRSGKDSGKKCIFVNDFENNIFNKDKRHTFSFKKNFSFS